MTRVDKSVGDNGSESTVESPSLADFAACEFRGTTRGVVTIDEAKIAPEVTIAATKRTKRCVGMRLIRK